MSLPLHSTRLEVTGLVMMLRDGPPSNLVQLRTREEVMHEGCSDSESASNSNDDGEGVVWAR